MKKFGKILSRRLGRDGDGGDRPSLHTSASSPDFHQLTSRRLGQAGDAIITGKRPRRPGAGSRIIADHAEGDGGRLDDHDLVGEDGVDGQSEGGDADRTVAVGGGRAVSKICDTCAGIEFPRVLDWHVGDPRPWVPLSHTLADSDCPYCTFFQAMVGEEPGDETGKFTPYLRIRQAFERLGSVGEKHELAREVLIEVLTRNKSLPWGYILKAADDERSVDGYLDTTPAIRGRTVTPLLDSVVPKTWLEYCERNHGDQGCGGTDAPVDNLRLIDCGQRRVVSAEVFGDESVKYVALSYVRGGDVAGENDAPGRRADDALPTRIPRLIEDAISFTKALGYQYLWVDRYCLPPLSAEQRRRQLDDMGDIYARAAVTFVVAAGESAERGIPGISEERDDQLSIQTSRGLFTTSLLRPDIEISRSKWASRGWTYQEGLLSRRRLVFTPSQVYFQCQCLHCHESISLPLSLASTVNLGRVFPEPDALSRPGQLRNQIKAYIGKEHTNNSDRLDAFRGVLQRYARMELPVKNFLGLPLFHYDDFRIAKVVSETDRLAVALGWMPDRTVPFQGYVDPYYLQDTFPSWTWLAWRLKPDQSTLNHSFHFNLVDETASPTVDGVSAAPKMEISVGFDDLSVISWEIDGEAIARRNEARRITFLRVETYCFDLKIRWAEDAATLVDSPPLSQSGRDAIEAWFRSAMVTDGAANGPANGQSSSEPSKETTSAELPGNHDDKASSARSSSIDSGEHKLTAVLLSGRNWSDDGTESLATVLVCRRRNLRPQRDTQQGPESNGIDSGSSSSGGGGGGGPLVRLGAVGMTYKGLAVVGDKSAVMKGVVVVGQQPQQQQRRDLGVQMREVDLY